MATVRALKSHGGGPPVPPGKPLDPVYKEENVGLVDKGCENLMKHIENVKKAGINPVVCINSFYTDTKAEIEVIKKNCEAAGARVAVSEHWLKGKRIEKIAKEVYGADGVSYTPEAQTKLKKMESDPDIAKLGTCMVKTHLSLSHDPNLKGAPKGWTLPIRDILTYKGAGFVVPVAGAITLMPGTASDPAYRRIDVDVETRKVTGLF